MPDLTSKQRAHLRGLAHSLKPTVHVGKDGVTDAAVDNLRETFAGSELVKVRVLEAAPESAKDTAHALAARVEDAVVVQVMGRNATLYRPDPDEPEIRLPH
jgi:RNA-binding protein